MEQNEGQAWGSGPCSRAGKAHSKAKGAQLKCISQTKGGGPQRGCSHLLSTHPSSRSPSTAAPPQDPDAQSLSGTFMACINSPLFPQLELFPSGWVLGGESSDGVGRMRPAGRTTPFAGDQSRGPPFARGLERQRPDRSLPTQCFLLLQLQLSPASRQEQPAWHWQGKHRACFPAGVQKTAGKMS